MNQSAAGRDPAANAEPRYTGDDSSVQEIYLDDRLGRSGCACTAGCRVLVGSFRLGTGRYRRLRRVYVASTPSEFLGFSAQAVAQRRHSLAVFDLNAYKDMDAVMEAARLTSEKRGRVNRDVARATRLGYYAKPFAFAQFIPDIVAVHQSKEVRGGRPLKGEFYAKDAEALGGAPTQTIGIEPPACPQHHWLYWGVFRQAEGYRQGEVETGEQLVGYVRLRRQGDAAAYTSIMGHGNHLADGVMYLLHYEIVAAMLRQAEPERPRYLIYQNYSAGEGDTLGVWKHRALFQPRYLRYVEERPPRFPRRPPMPGLGEGLLVLKSTVQQTWGRATETAAQYGVSDSWLKLLHHLWVVEIARAPGLVARMLRAGPNPPLDVLRPLASGMFPLETIDARATVDVVLDGDDRGLESLIQLFDAGFRRVAIHHTDGESAAALTEIYGGDWTFGVLGVSTALAGDALIAECPAVNPMAFLSKRMRALLKPWSGRLVLSIGEHALGNFGYDAERTSAVYRKDPGAEAPLIERLVKLLDRPLRYKGFYYRSGDPEDAFWIVLDVG